MCDCIKLFALATLCNKIKANKSNCGKISTGGPNDEL